MRDRHETCKHGRYRTCKFEKEYKAKPRYEDPSSDGGGQRCARPVQEEWSEDLRVKQRREV